MRLERGDILFQNIGCDAICRAINDVTSGIDGARIDHCAIASDDRTILEAIFPAVAYKPLPVFLSRSSDDAGRPRVLVGRLRRPYRELIENALASCDRHVGKTYDMFFADDNASFYCSELIVSGFEEAKGAPFFAKHPMSFKDRATGEIHPVWERFFRIHGRAVPEGELGSNPGELSKAPQIEIVHQFGDLEGLPIRR